LNLSGYLTRSNLNLYTHYLKTTQDAKNFSNLTTYRFNQWNPSY